MKRAFVALALLVVISSAGTAQSSWRMDRAHTSIGFSITHMVISEVTGNFTDFDIKFASDKEDFSDGIVEATIKTASITTSNERRDNHLKSNDFFNADSFPTIRFVSTKFEPVSAKEFRIHGDLTIRNVTRPVVFNATLNGTLKTQRGTVTGWKATLVIDRFDFNLKWDRTIETGGLIAGKDVTITVNAEFLKQ